MENHKQEGNANDLEKVADYDAQSARSKSTDRLSMVRAEKDNEAQTPDAEPQAETNGDLVGPRLTL